MSNSYLNRFGAIDFSHTIERLADGFVGREWLFDKLDDWLKQENGEKFYLLTGEPGVGKSAIAAQLTQRWTHKVPEEGLLAAYHFCRSGDVETARPGRVLRSLATQLGKTLPHYKEALKEVIDPVYLHIKAEINIGTLSNSQVTGIYVENLKALDPREEFRLLIQAPLAVLSNIYTKLGKTPPVLKVFLIDSLDEAATTTGQENMMTLLASLYQASETLPPWVRFLLTARPDRDVLNRFLPLQSQKIEELEEENLSDIQKYIQGRIDNQLRGEPSTPESQVNNAPVSNPKPLKQRLEEADITTEKLVQEVKDLSKGNFLYTKLLLNSIASGEQSIKNLAALPKDLNDIYHRMLRYRCSSRRWLKRYQPILGMLSVTQEPINQGQLSQFIGIKTEELTKELEVFGQFLDESKDEQEQTLYTIFHQSLREYLLNKKHNHDFWCDAQEQHHGIIECFENESDRWRDLRAINLYGLRHLAQHLVQGEQQEELHTLLKRETIDRHNAWFDAKDSKEDTLGFLADVALAWQIADQEFTTCQSSNLIGLQCRYALTVSSINSLTGNLPTELVIELMKKDSAKGWAYFRQLIFNQQIDLEILSKLETQALNSEFESKFLQEVENISNKSYQTQVKCALAQYFPKKLLEILETVKTIENEKDKDQALRMLVPYLSEDLLPKVLEIAEGISEEIGEEISDEVASIASEILGMLPQYFQQSKNLLINVLERSKTFYNQYRANVLIGLVPYLSEDLLPKALEIALDMDDPSASEESQSRSLRALATAPHLKNADLVEKIQLQAEAFQNRYYKTLVLSGLANHLSSDQINMILQDVQRLEYENEKAEVLSTLTSQLPSDQLHKILQEVQRLKDENEKAEVLSTLTSRLPSDQLHKILQEIQEFKDESSKALALKGLSTTPGLTADMVENIQQQVKAFKNNDNKSKVLSALARYLSSTQLHKILQEVQTIGDKNYHPKTIRNLLAHLSSDQIDKVIQEVELSEEVQAIDHEYYEHLDLGELTIYLPLDQLDKILQEVHTLEDESSKALALKGLATTPDLTADLIENIQQQVKAFKNNNNKSKVLSALARYLPSTQLHKILQEVRTISDKNDKANALSTLATHLPSDQLHKILQEIQALDDKYFKVQVLSALAFRLPSVQPHNQLYKEHKAQVLSVLAPHLPLDQLDEILQEVHTLEDESYRALVLSALVPHLPSEKLPEVLKLTQAIQNDFARADALRVIVIVLTKPPHADLHDLWSKMLHILASRNRRSLLSDFRKLTPIIASLGKDEAIVNICHAIKDIGRQWS